MDSKQIQALKKHSSELAQFITRLSSFYEGIDGDIDKELQVLRSHLAGNPNFTLATVSMSKVSKLLMTNQNTLKKITSSQTQQMHEDIKELQKIEGLPANLCKDATDLLISLNQPVSSTMSLYSLLLRTYELQKNALYSPLDNEEENITAAFSSDPETKKLRQTILDELSQLVETYSISNPEDANIASLRERIAMGLNDAELLHSCLVVIRLMVKDSMTEATATGRVIQHLEQSLSLLDQNVNDSIDMSEQSFEAQKATRKQLKSAIDTIGEAVNQSESLETLKNQAQTHLEKMNSTLDEREIAEKAEQAGLMSLLTRMQSQLVSLQKQTHFYRKKLKQQRMSIYTDPLTKVPNRMAYNERSAKEWQQSQTKGTPLSIALVDVDHFKRINDQYGHAAGDKTLQVIARHLKGQLEQSEFIARWGGEEFVILFPNSALTAIESRLDTIRASLSKLPFKFKQERVTVTVSIGATQCQQQEELEKAFERADNYLYDAKKAGRNCVTAK